MQKLEMKDRNIYVGLDVHRKKWVATVLSEHVVLKTMQISPAKASVLGNYLKRVYPGARYHCAYEAGYCGFWIHDTLEQEGITTKVIHPADIPTTDKEKRFKEDRRDSRKIALALRGGLLHGIYVPSEEQRRVRQLVRQRYTCHGDLQRVQIRIRAHLANRGPEPSPSEIGKYWSKRMIDHLHQRAIETGDDTLKMLLSALEANRKLSLQSTRCIRDLSREARFEKQVKLLTSLPGVGVLTAMVFLTEIWDVSRFPWDKLHAYCGLVPGTHASGERDIKTHLTKRGNKYLRTALILSSWVAIRTDSELNAVYETLRHRMKGQNAIIRIAKKQANRMKSVLENNKMFTIQ